MRVSTLSNFIFLTSEAQKQFERISKLLREISSGKRSDLYTSEPEKVDELVSVKWDIAKVNQYEDNIKFAKGILLTADDVLGKVYDTLVTVKEKLVEAANAHSDGEYETLKQTLRELKNRLLQYANTRVGDYYIFAGDKYTSQPYDANGNYSGGDEFSVKVSDNDSSILFVKGSQAFGNGDNSVFAVIQNAIDNITDQDTVEKSIADIAKYISDVDSLRAKIGANEQKLEGYYTTYSEILNNLKKRKSDIEGIEVDEAISDYQLANTTYKSIISVLGKEFSQNPVLLKYF
jgi:flagellar hook-associated protein 3 FlgL